MLWYERFSSSLAFYTRIEHKRNRKTLPKARFSEEAGRGYQGQSLREQLYLLTHYPGLCTKRQAGIRFLGRFCLAPPDFASFCAF